MTRACSAVTRCACSKMASHVLLRSSSAACCNAVFVKAAERKAAIVARSPPIALTAAAIVDISARVISGLPTYYLRHDAAHNGDGPQRTRQRSAGGPGLG